MTIFSALMQMLRGVNNGWGRAFNPQPTSRGDGHIYGPGAHVQPTIGFQPQKVRFRK